MIPSPSLKRLRLYCFSCEQFQDEAPKKCSAYDEQMPHTFGFIPENVISRLKELRDDFVRGAVLRDGEWTVSINSFNVKVNKLISELEANQ